MKRFLFGRHGLLLFRSYLFLAAGLLITATVLDVGFEYLQSNQEPAEDPWLATTFELIVRELAAVPVAQRDQRAAELGNAIGIGVRILQRDDVYTTTGPQGRLPPLVDADGNTSYLRDAPSLNALIRVGPVEPQRDSIFVRLLPPIFYLSIFVVVGLWLRPFFRDLDLISSGADRFAADYREPLATASATKQLTGLARNLDAMSARLSGLIQSQKELIAALSHEMRTPLARIRFALAVIGNKGDDDLKRRIDDLNNDVQEIDQLIATMLSYARLDHPDLRMHWQQVPIVPWLEETQDKVRQSAKELSIVKDESLTTAWMDPRLMGLALSNLLVNACRYARQTVSCSLHERDGSYEIRIEDDGKGIPEAERKKIFKAFARIDDSRNRETGGYGLGLAIVARIAELHGGTVSVGESKELGGACFVLSWSHRPD
ncbi:MAG: ATP-binding protein [Gammaproteobacteria bacterium]|nr:ATP-binding protein [Gammaproteobacteria bacterium]